MPLKLVDGAKFHPYGAGSEVTESTKNITQDILKHFKETYPEMIEGEYDEPAKSEKSKPAKQKEPPVHIDKIPGSGETIVNKNVIINEADNKHDVIITPAADRKAELESKNKEKTITSEEKIELAKLRQG